MCVFGLWPCESADFQGDIEFKTILNACEYHSLIEKEPEPLPIVLDLEFE